MVALMPSPAAFVAGGSRVLAVNRAWIKAVAPEEYRYGHERPRTLDDWLSGYADTNTLIDTLSARTMTSGAVTMHSTVLAAESDLYECVAHWRQVSGATPEASMALVTLSFPSEHDHLESVIHAQRVRINQLLIRQSIIEETERQHLGRAMHDGVVQDLAHIRVKISRSMATDIDHRALVAELDAVIESLRAISFELSPPMLGDLGLNPALGWLAEYLSARYNQHISFVRGGGNEPALSLTNRTIIFRSIRELAINAAKHAAGSTITVTSSTDDLHSRFEVRDSGPGFDITSTHYEAQRVMRFGLLSVEQQIRAIGGTFHIVSTKREGTRASIVMPLAPESEPTDVS